MTDVELGEIAKGEGGLVSPEQLMLMAHEILLMRAAVRELRDRTNQVDGGALIEIALAGEKV